MTTAREIVTTMLRRIGAVTANESPTAGELVDGLSALNQMVESWANDGLLVYARTEESFTLTGATEYTVGSGQDFDTVPFNFIVSAYVRQGTTDYPLTGITDREYARLSTKTTTIGVPDYYNYNNGFPSAILRFWPVPSEGTLYVVSEKPLISFAADTTISLPAGWERALISNGAIEVAPEYGLEPSASLANAAVTSLAGLRRQISKARSVDWGPQSIRDNNIYNGYYNR